MSNEQDATDKWIAAGLAELAEGGVERVRVEVVAERLGVTKGGFYRRFKDRRAFLDAILEHWSRGRIDALDRHMQTGNVTPRARLEGLITLYSERVSARGMAIELATRQWARYDSAAAAAVASVDAHRLRKVEDLYRELGLPAEQAQARAILFYSFIFGQSLLFPQHSPRKHASLIAACKGALTDVAVIAAPPPQQRKSR